MLIKNGFTGFVSNLTKAIFHHSGKLIIGIEDSWAALYRLPLVYETASIVAASQRIKGLDLKSDIFFERIKGYAALNGY